MHLGLQSDLPKLTKTSCLKAALLSVFGLMKFLANVSLSKLLREYNHYLADMALFIIIA